MSYRGWRDAAPSASFGHSVLRAMINLGLLYANGLGVAQDSGKAREWFEKAAAKGDADAKEQLGR